jgi:ABC-type transport system involved in cytochrome c biogenesis ATPase subunit
METGCCMDKEFLAKYLGHGSGLEQKLTKEEQNDFSEKFSK